MNIRAGLLKSGYADNEIRDALKVEDTEKSEKAAVAASAEKMHPITDWLKKYKAAIAIFLCLQILIILVIVVTKVQPPTVYFLDKATNTFQIGEVFFDGKLIGTAQGRFDSLPVEYCNGVHVLEFRAAGEKIVWDTNPADCKLDSVKYSFTIRKESIEAQPDTVALNFTAPNMERITGTLRFDNVTRGLVIEQFVITKDECRNISNVEVIAGEARNITIYSWQHNAADCDSDVITYTTGLK